MRLWRPLVLLQCCAVEWASSSCESGRYASRIAFAGGFGAKAKKTKRPKPKKGRGGGGFGAPPQKDDGDGTTATVQETKDGPVLDKWGLPPPTEEDIFPPMPPGTELISADSGNLVGLPEIEDALKNHIDLDLHRFNEDATAKTVSAVEGKPMKVKLLHVSPPVLSIDNFFTEEECLAVKRVAEPASNIQDDDTAVQVDSATFSPMALSKRTSTSWFCHYAQMPTLLAKAHYALGIPLEQMEEPQIVRYRTGEEFSWHYDEVPPAQLANGGQRLATLLVYLNDVDRGGGTIFRDLKAADGSQLTVKPKRGSALLFFPAFGDGRPDDRTLHKGEVALDEKWITQMWIHERAYKAAVPPGNSHEAASAAVEQVSKSLGYIE